MGVLTGYNIFKSIAGIYHFAKKNDYGKIASRKKLRLFLFLFILKYQRFMGRLYERQAESDVDH